MLGFFQPCVQLLAGVQAGFVEGGSESGKVQHAQRYTGAIEDVLIASTAFMQLALSATHAEQGDERQQRKGQAQQALANKGR
ncbi:hypothetical protein D3C86_1999420 [compost metagenome]